MTNLRFLRALGALLALAALAAAFSPATMAAKRRCVKLKERAGCPIKLGGYAGNTTFGSRDTYALLLSIGDSSGFSTVRGALARASCTGGDPNHPPEQRAQLVQTLRLPKHLVVGKKYKKSGHIDRVDDTGQTRVRLVSTESVKVKILSARKARVTIALDQTTQTVEPANDQAPVHCVGSGTEVLKRRY